VTAAAPQLRDVVIVGAGAAGLATAIFTRERNARRSVLVLDGARRPGAKILVSGGGRCNVTNTIVSERDYWGGPATVVRRILHAFPADAAVAFFARAGVSLHEEEDGKLFPDTNSARAVLEALLRQLEASGAELRADHRVLTIDRHPDGFFLVHTSHGPLHASRVVLATGGQSLPKSGSDGAGYVMAQALGHELVPTTPALAPLVVASDPDPDPASDTAAAPSIHTEIPGVSHDTELTLWIGGAAAIRLRGALLWTHFGVSGPVVLNMSRHWLRARLESTADHAPRVTARFTPDLDYEQNEQHWLAESRNRPRSTLGSTLARLLPGSMAAALLSRLGLDGTAPLAHVDRESRRRLVRGLVEWPLAIRDSRGYSYAEATAGGINLREINPATMESRRCPGLYLVGEILDVDGRLGGFNFQWAWSSGYVAASALAKDDG
jgi:predicted Rossmann fold flavoprotein